MSLNIRLKSLLLNGLIVLVFISNNTIISLLLVALLFFSLCIFHGNLRLDVTKFLVVSSIILAIALNFMYVEIKTYLRLTELLMGFLFYPLILKKDDINVWALRFVILYIFIFFVGNMLNIGTFQNLILKWYPTEGNPWLILYDSSEDIVNPKLANFFSQRLASIYYNPNILGQNMVFCITFYLLIRFEQKLTLIDYIFLGLNIILILGSGSRTAFVALLIIAFFYIYHFSKKITFYSLVVPGISYILYFIAFNTRLLKLVFTASSNKAEDSMGLKNEILANYFHDFSFDRVLNYVFGHLSFDIQFDNDLGDITYNLGIFGICSIAVFILKEGSMSTKKTIYFYSFILLSYGATLFINYKFFIHTIILLSILHEFNFAQRIKDYKDQTSLVIK